MANICCINPNKRHIDYYAYKYKKNDYIKNIMIIKTDFN